MTGDIMKQIVPVLTLVTCLAANSGVMSAPAVTGSNQDNTQLRQEAPVQHWDPNGPYYMYPGPNMFYESSAYEKRNPSSYPKGVNGNPDNFVNGYPPYIDSMLENLANQQRVPQYANGYEYGYFHPRLY
ncbi:uncharacterized protein [Periplaneta americana]|uniref:uncharacterized protein n=1 Tax=Periplaneta americana TaxID=6978 RepID=UPI0037E70362